jgi:hypothetical protein
VLLFLSPEDQARLDAVIIAHLDELIPETFLGWPTRIKLHDANAPDADAEGRRPAALRVEAHSLRSWVRGWLGARADAELDWRAWLGLPEQALLEVTEGSVYRDDGGELGALRHRLAYFPRDVWLYKIACQWVRIGQEQAFVGRCGDVGDDIGSRIITARLAHDVMRLCFLVERRYVPSKSDRQSHDALFASRQSLHPGSVRLRFAVSGRADALSCRRYWVRSLDSWCSLG